MYLLISKCWTVQWTRNTLDIKIWWYRIVGYIKYRIPVYSFWKMIIIHNDSNQLNQSLGANRHYPPINDSYIYMYRGDSDKTSSTLTKHHQYTTIAPTLIDQANNQLNGLLIWKVKYLMAILLLILWQSFVIVFNKCIHTSKRLFTPMPMLRHHSTFLYTNPDN